MTEQPQFDREPVPVDAILHDGLIDSRCVAERLVQRRVKQLRRGFVPAHDAQYLTDDLNRLIAWLVWHVYNPVESRASAGIVASVSTKWWQKEAARLAIEHHHDPLILLEILGATAIAEIQRIEYIRHSIAGSPTPTPEGARSSGYTSPPSGDETTTAPATNCGP